MREHLKEVVERALQRELATRRSLRPHAQLGIAPDTTPTEIDKAYARLRGRYETISIAEYGSAAVEAASSIAELLRTAHESMQRAHGNGTAVIEPVPQLEPRPRADETCRALQTLHGAIARRLAEAEEHRRAGRLHEAIRMFEFVLLLDRSNGVARHSIRELRAAVQATRGSAFARIISRVFKRPSVINADPGASGA